jgi:hypothetical protein
MISKIDDIKFKGINFIVSDKIYSGSLSFILRYVLNNKMFLKFIEQKYKKKYSKNTKKITKKLISINVRKFIKLKIKKDLNPYG